MPIKINYSVKSPKKLSANTVLFVDEKFKIDHLKKYLLDNELSYISDLLKTSDLKKKFLIFKINSKKKISLISIKKESRQSDFENLGAEFFVSINQEKEVSII